MSHVFHVFAVPPVVLFSDADVAHHPLHLLQLTSVQFSVADPDPGSGAFLTPGSETPGAFLMDPVPFWPPGSGIRCLFDPWIRDPAPF
jgi:hypothetical protein